ncbi:MAG: DNA-3-methyladenine glycosylase 2 family protein [Bacteroidetes bacterium]|nr:DNA-3-methyladenine glycosylase 2 family protein [Bacteroidota bacterium]MDE2672009.1 DNA-3-methyladenine glycosylase 2 family protein [Bacteroidota bacterium]
MLSLEIDGAVNALRASDTHMANLIARVGPFELALTDEWSPFQALVRSVIFQQISTHAGRAIQGRLFSLFDGSAPEPDAVLQTTPEELRGVGLSQAKEKTIRNLAVHAADGTLPDRVAMEKLTDEEIIKTLTIHRGIGIWTAQMLLIFNLGRPDVWPVTDLGIRRGYKIAYGLDELPMPSELRDIGDRWKPFRSIASWYLWRANDL